MQSTSTLARLFIMRHPDEDVRRRGQNLLIVLWGLICLSVLSMPSSLLNGMFGSLLNSIVVLPLGGWLLWMTHRGWVSGVAWTSIVANTLSLVLVPVLGSAPFAAIVYYFILNILIAGSVMRPGAIWSVLGLNFAALLLTAYLSRNSPQEAISTTIITINVSLLLAFVALIAFLNSTTTTRALRETGKSREEAQRASQALAANLATLESQAARLQETEQMLRSLVGDLETPTVALADGVLLAPIVGQMDEARAALLQSRLLAAAGAGKTRLMVIDVAGVRSVDTQVASGLLQTARALRLIGCNVAITGISSDVAATLAGFQLSLEEIITARSPQEVLAIAEPALR